MQRETEGRDRRKGGEIEGKRDRQRDRERERGKDS